MVGANVSLKNGKIPLQNLDLLPLVAEVSVCQCQVVVGDCHGKMVLAKVLHGLLLLFWTPGTFVSIHSLCVCVAIVHALGWCELCVDFVPLSVRTLPLAP